MKYLLEEREVLDGTVGDARVFVLSTIIKKYDRVLYVAILVDKEITSKEKRIVLRKMRKTLWNSIQKLRASQPLK